MDSHNFSPQPVRITARDGEGYMLRQAQPADARQMIRNLQLVADEDVYLATERVRWSADDLAALIQESSEHSLIFVVEGKRGVIGDSWIMRGRSAKTRHACSLGMQLLPGYRDRGIGSHMMAYGLRWARNADVQKVFLSLFETNHRARHLYEKFGFVEEGRRPRQFIIRDEPVAEIIMGLLL